MTAEDKLKDLYKRANELNEELPGELLAKLKLYGEILGLTGRLHADALQHWRLCEALRKETIAKCYTYDPEGTVKDKEYKAEFAASEHRKQEALAEATCIRWKNAYCSTLEVINIMKIQLRDMKDLNNGGV